jgi:hypothetical protein
VEKLSKSLYQTIFAQEKVDALIHLIVWGLAQGEMALFFEEYTNVLAYFPDGVWRQVLVLVFGSQFIGEWIKVVLDFHEV